MGQIPADPRLGKMMILGAAFSCIDPILSVVTYLEYKSPFVATGKIKDSVPTKHDNKKVVL